MAAWHKKLKIPIFKKSLKSWYLVIICNLTHIQEGNTKVNFIVTNIRKNSCSIRNNIRSRSRIPKPSEKSDPKPSEKSDPGPKNYFGSTTRGGGGVFSFYGIGKASLFLEFQHNSAFLKVQCMRFLSPFFLKLLIIQTWSQDSGLSRFFSFFLSIEILCILRLSN